MKKLTKFSSFQAVACIVGAIALGTLIAQLPTLPTSQAVTKSTAPAVAYHAKVIAVSDGDSITVRAGRETIKIRLAQIDAPERGQPWGQKSRQELGRLVGGQTIIVIPKEIDRYGRTIADLALNGRDVNQSMVMRGAAWAYVDYARDNTMADLESRARSQRQGLWTLPESQRIAPWEYRRQQRESADVSTAR